MSEMLLALSTVSKQVLTLFILLALGFILGKAKVITKEGVTDITLYVKGLTQKEKQIILDGCLINYYASTN